MRYELRRWTDSTHTDYVVRHTSDDYSAINQQFNRAFFNPTPAALRQPTQSDALREALELCLGELFAPEAHCSCHICPPCNDCVEYSSIREAIAAGRAALQGHAQPTQSDALVMAIAEMSRARGRLEIIGVCDEDNRIADALGSTCDHIRRAFFASSEPNLLHIVDTEKENAMQV